MRWACRRTWLPKGCCPRRMVDRPRCSASLRSTCLPTSRRGRQRRSWAVRTACLRCMEPSTPQVPLAWWQRRSRSARRIVWSGCVRSTQASRRTRLPGFPSRMRTMMRMRRTRRRATRRRLVWTKRMEAGLRRKETTRRRRRRTMTMGLMACRECQKRAMKKCTRSASRPAANLPKMRCSSRTKWTCPRTFPLACASSGSAASRASAPAPGT
mmetsp:Transcript_3313/g.10402  ORF Transcript_3313/g.10402 Transcript_3313/m.10402 type:complete len:212 (-) Transcript_3313:176-811(-)